MKYLKVILPIVIVMLAGAIFLFSAQPAAESDKLSKTFTKEVVKLFLEITDQDVGKTTEITNKIHGMIRKYAHFTLYMLLGMLSVMFFSAVVFKKYSFAGVFCAVTICVLYACSDEYHQTFVAGRSGELRDVMIDTLGAVIGIFVVSTVGMTVTGIKKLINKKKGIK